MQLTGVIQESLSVHCYEDLNLGHAFKVSHSQQSHINSISKHRYNLFSPQKLFHIILLWVDPTQAPLQLLADSAHASGTGEGIGGAKMRKLVSQD